RDPGVIAYDLDRHVPDLEAGLGEQTRGLGQQHRAPDPGPARPRAAEVGAQIAEPGRREQRVADRVGCDVPVGMTGQPELAGPQQPREVQRPAFTERVDVRPDAYLRKYA